MADVLTTHATALDTIQEDPALITSAVAANTIVSGATTVNTPAVAALMTSQIIWGGQDLASNRYRR